MDKSALGPGCSDGAQRRACQLRMGRGGVREQRGGTGGSLGLLIVLGPGAVAGGGGPEEARGRALPRQRGRRWAHRARPMRPANPAGHPLGFVHATQRLHGPAAQQGARRQRHERPLPAERLSQPRRGVERDEGQCEADAGLQRQGGVDARGIRELGHSGRDLGRVRDDPGPPDGPEECQRREGEPECPGAQQEAGGRRSHRDGGGPSATQPIGDQASHDRPRAASDPDAQKRHQPIGRAFARRRRRTRPDRSTWRTAPTCGRSSRGWPAGWASNPGCGPPAPGRTEPGGPGGDHRGPTRPRSACRAGPARPRSSERSGSPASGPMRVRPGPGALPSRASRPPRAPRSPAPASARRRGRRRSSCPGGQTPASATPVPKRRASATGRSRQPTRRRG